MQPKFYIEDNIDWFTDYVIDYIQFDAEGRIDVIREDEERHYIVEQNITLPKFETEYEYINYLTGRYIHEDFAKKLQQLVGYKLEEIEINAEAVDNVLAFDNPFGRKLEDGSYKSVAGTDMAAVLPHEASMEDAIIKTMKVKRTLLHNGGKQQIRPLIRLK